MLIMKNKSSQNENNRCPTKLGCLEYESKKHVDFWIHDNCQDKRYLYWELYHQYIKYQTRNTERYLTVLNIKVQISGAEQKKSENLRICKMRCCKLFIIPLSIILPPPPIPKTGFATNKCNLNLLNENNKTIRLINIDKNKHKHRFSLLWDKIKNASNF